MVKRVSEEYNIDVAEYNDKDDHWSESKLGVAAITEPLEAQAAAAGDFKKYDHCGFDTEMATGVTIQHRDEVSSTVVVSHLKHCLLVTDQAWQ